MSFAALPASVCLSASHALDRQRVCRDLQPSAALSECAHVGQFCFKCCQHHVGGDESGGLVECTRACHENDQHAHETQTALESILSSCVGGRGEVFAMCSQASQRSSEAACRRAVCGHCCTTANDKDQYDTQIRDECAAQCKTNNTLIA
ncbi:unnamed protein product [Vitrella brassicaformis CCMP3155]|uniref:Uncharacterized protein n=1 Tax=Vitrella brassicaformis (strain CCMP3155) TaxID=1169540 RepID=A0A0G4E8T7_VITBC|nr:unnamed protein product [Vitrella brassicaformis CCMP3155]|eukprot:CEL91616.1 unnamed protein product [Vitrella brassicaformis CCMP3155]